MREVAAYLKANDRAFVAAMQKNRYVTALKLLKSRAEFLKEAGLVPR